jgi:two-component system, OmpR family, phosphate regulon sensor histidine kinase PhoR
MTNNLFKRSLKTLFAVILVAALVFAAVSGSVMSSAYSEANEAGLARSAWALAAAFPEGAVADAGLSADYVKKAASSGYRVTLISPDGTVLLDSEADPRAMENHAKRPEVAQALAGFVSSSRRRSATLGEELAYAAAPIKNKDGAVEGAIRLALHTPTLDRALKPSWWKLAAAALAFVVAAVAAAAAFSRMMSGPLAALTERARSYGSGKPQGSGEGEWAVRKDEPEEFIVLASTLDAMAAEIGARVAEAEKQRSELEAILDAMGESVLALDSQLRITAVNPAARSLFGLEGEAKGRGLLEATRSSVLQELASDCIARGERRAIEMSLYLPTERSFRAFASPLSAGSAGASSGLVIVLDDTTELRRLERVRRDFVANVSHELRTPVQVIKGFAESLKEGSPIGDDQSARFLGIIERNASRMESLIADLLSLASLEGEGQQRIKTERSEIAPVLYAAREAILPKAAENGTAIEIECEEGLSAEINAGLLEQALVNLIDNAVKYSPRDSRVDVAARAEPEGIVLEVRDKGIGIPSRDLGRVFERFYRVDKARSRELGGTGLGLAIVRHIAMAHGGSVSVESWEGEGSTFRIRIPSAG